MRKYYSHNSYRQLQTLRCVLSKNRAHVRVEHMFLYTPRFGCFCIRPIFRNIISTKQASEISTKTKNDNSEITTYCEISCIKQVNSLNSHLFKHFRGVEVTNLRTPTIQYPPPSQYKSNNVFISTNIRFFLTIIHFFPEFWEKSWIMNKIITVFNRCFL